MTTAALLWWHAITISANGWLLIVWAAGGCGLGASLLRDEP